MGDLWGILWDPLLILPLELLPITLSQLLVSPQGLLQICRFIGEFHKDMEALGCLAPTLEPKATDHVSDMVSTIEQIISNGHGYAVSGDVFFDVASLPGYGRLSGRAQVPFVAQQTFPPPPPTPPHPIRWPLHTSSLCDEQAPTLPSPPLSAPCCAFR